MLQASSGLRGRSGAWLSSLSGVGSNSVGNAQQRQGMRLFCPAFAHALLYVAGGDRAVRADVVGLVTGHLPEHRPPDLHGVFVVLGFDAQVPSWPEQRSTVFSVVPGTNCSVSRVFCPMFCTREWHGIW